MLSFQRTKDPSSIPSTHVADSHRGSDTTAQWVKVPAAKLGDQAGSLDPTGQGRSNSLHILAPPTIHCSSGHNIGRSLSHEYGHMLSQSCQPFWQISCLGMVLGSPRTQAAIECHPQPLSTSDPLRPESWASQEAVRRVTASLG